MNELQYFYEYSKKRKIEKDEFEEYFPSLIKVNNIINNIITEASSNKIDKKEIKNLRSIKKFINNIKKSFKNGEFFEEPEFEQKQYITYNENDIYSKELVDSLNQKELYVIFNDIFLLSSEEIYIFEDYFKKLKLEIENIINNNIDLNEFMYCEKHVISSEDNKINNLRNNQKKCDIVIQILKEKDINIISKIRNIFYRNTIYSYNDFVKNTINKIFFKQNKKLKDNIDYISDEFFKIVNYIEDKYNIKYSKNKGQETNEGIEEIFSGSVEKILNPLLNPFISLTKEVYEKSSNYLYENQMENECTEYKKNRMLEFLKNIAIEVQNNTNFPNDLNKTCDYCFR